MSVDVARARAGLAAAGWGLHYVATCGSTNDLAARMAREGRLALPMVVLTSRQVRGRGRGGNRWSSDGGTLTATFAMAPSGGRRAEHLGLVAGVAAREAVQRVVAEGGGAARVEIKWPNDLVVGRRKAAGLLCERVGGAAAVDLVGVGVNVSTALRGRLRETGTSLRELGVEASVTGVLVALGGEMGRWVLGEVGVREVLRRFGAHDALAGREVVIEAGGETVAGRCEGVDGEGRLLVRRGDGGVERVVAGHVASW